MIAIILNPLLIWMVWFHILGLSGTLHAIINSLFIRFSKASSYQFIPVFSPLTEEAVHEAETGEIGGAAVRVVGALHLAVIALSVGRPKDFLRILTLMEAGAVNEEELQKLAARHSLTNRWLLFKRRFLDG